MRPSRAHSYSLKGLRLGSSIDTTFKPIAPELFRTYWGEGVGQPRRRVSGPRFDPQKTPEGLSSSASLFDSTMPIRLTPKATICSVMPYGIAFGLPYDAAGNAADVPF